jgi:hypothetical protein
MRAASWVLALVSALAATGCGVSSRPEGAGQARGTPGSTYTVTINPANGQGSPPLGGRISGGGGTIDCGTDEVGTGTRCVADFPWSSVPIVLTASPGSGYTSWMWAGDCSGSAQCTLSGNADKMVMVRFFKRGQETGHSNYSDPAVHGPAATNGALACSQCHGADLQGQGIAPSCSLCHSASAGASCLLCHGGPPPAPHASRTDCGACHTGYSSGSVVVATHMNGRVEVEGQSCT